jgi:signal peptidase II
LKRNFSTYLPLVIFASLIVALDQWTKWLVRTNIPFGGSWLPNGWDWLGPYARIVNWANTGAAFGMFQNGNTVFSILAVIVILVIFYYYPQVERSDWYLRLAMGMQMAGAAGNLVDRLTVGQVTDFISVGTFPVFNVADSSISVGVVVLLLGVWIKERAEKKSQLSVNSDQSPVSSEPPTGTSQLSVISNQSSVISNQPSVISESSSENETTR